MGSEGEEIVFEYHPQILGSESKTQGCPGLRPGLSQVN